MLKVARPVMAESARLRIWTFPTSWVLPRFFDNRTGARVRWFPNRWHVRGFLMSSALLLLAALAGLIVGWSMADRSAHRNGACIAVHMAAALGYLDEQQQRRVMHALVTAVNPEVDHFPGGHRAMRQACDAVAGG